MLSEEQALSALKALANPTRLQIMGWLEHPADHFPPQDVPPEEVGVCLKHIQAKAGISQSTTSHFMATLARAGLVESRRLGQWTHYKRNESMMQDLADYLRAADS